MTLLRPSFALTTLFCSAADAGPKRSHVNTKLVSSWRAARIFLLGDPISSAGVWGAVEVLDDLGSDTKLFCPPETASTLERVRVIVTYVEGVPKRMTDGFGLLANEAMAKAWPCKS